MHAVSASVSLPLLSAYVQDPALNPWFPEQLRLRAPQVIDPVQVGVPEKVIELAVDEARRLGHHHIGTEHILLGLIREHEGIAGGVLESLGVTLERVRAATLRVLGDQATVPPAADDGRLRLRLVGDRDAPATSNGETS